MFKLGRVFIFIALLVSWGALPAGASLRVENFDAEPTGGFNNPLFNHSIAPVPLGGISASFEFSDQESISADYSLLLIPGMDIVTFNLSPGVTVDYAEVWVKGGTDPPTPTLVDVIGIASDGEPLDETLAPLSLDWTLLSTEGLGFLRIDEIRLIGIKEGFFDNLVVNVVPEPVTAAFLLVGAGGMLVSKRKRRLKA